MQELLNQVFCGECSELMATLLPANSINLTVTSPPYDNLRTYQGYNFDFEAIARQLFRVTKQGGVVVWVVGDATVNGSETGTSFRQALYFMELGFNLHDTMIYERFGRFPDVSRYRNDFEFMFVFAKSQPKTYHKIRDRKNVKPIGSSLRGTERTQDGQLLANRTHRVRKALGDKGNIWRYAAGLGSTTQDQIAYQHPAIFPEALARDHILSWSNPGDIVLDPMCGSGTTLKMCVLTGRQFIAFDISKEYCELAKKRIALAQSQPTLFNPYAIQSAYDNGDNGKSPNG